MNFELRNKFALVTGGSHGIGLATAIELCREGCVVAICSRSTEKLAAAKESIQNVTGSGCLTIEADVLELDDILSVSEQILKEWGTLHILVNNVGGGGRWGSDDIFGTDFDVWIDVFKKNVMSTAKFTGCFLPSMQKQKWGRVVAVTSIYGLSVGGRPWFNISKHSQTVLMQNLSIRDYAKDNITFNCVAPGDIMIEDTGWDIFAKQHKNFSAFLEKYPLRRLGTPEEVASAVVFLCSTRASLINGISLIVDGGQNICNSVGED